MSSSLNHLSPIKVQHIMNWAVVHSPWQLISFKYGLYYDYLSILLNIAGISLSHFCKSWSPYFAWFIQCLPQDYTDYVLAQLLISPASSSTCLSSVGPNNPPSTNRPNPPLLFQHANRMHHGVSVITSRQREGVRVEIASNISFHQKWLTSFVTSLSIFPIYQTMPYFLRPEVGNWFTEG